MNRLLASTLSALNVIYALMILAVCVVLGGMFMQPPGEFNVFGAIVGLMVGIVFASLICGLIAFLTLIEQHLSFLATSAEYQNDITKIRMDQGR